MSVLEYETKAKPAAMVKFDAGSGSGTCLFSRYGVEDADGDWTEYGALPDGAVLPLLVGHNWGELPRGKGTIRSTREAAYFDFTCATTRAGEELAEWLRFDYADGQPRSEFSYGFKILLGGSEYAFINGKRLRVLKPRDDGSAGLQPLEVSYVLKGSGVSTALIAMKGEEQYRLAQLHAKINRQIQEQHEADQRDIRQIFQRLGEKGHLR